MLKRKLARKNPATTLSEISLTKGEKTGERGGEEDKEEAEILNTNINKQQTSMVQINQKTSKLFATQLWKLFFDLESVLNVKLSTVNLPPSITHSYNPVEYAEEVHCSYLQRYLGNTTKRLMFVGMNPGPNGMAQTGVPFGNISTVRDVMKLHGLIRQPLKLHPKRPIQGFGCNIEEPSGVRIWTLLARLAGGSLDTFSQQCFVHNFCPLAYFDERGRNITPSEVKGDYKLTIRDECLATLDQEIALLRVEIVVAIGDYVFTSMKRSQHWGKLRILKLGHPSPRVLNNQNWPEKAEKMLTENNLLRYLRNE